MSRVRRSAGGDHRAGAGDDREVATRAARHRPCTAARYGSGSTRNATMRSPEAPRPTHLGVQGREWTMKKNTNTRLRVKLQIIRQLTETDYRAVVGGSTLVYTCPTGAQSGQPTVTC